MSTAAKIEIDGNSKCNIKPYGQNPRIEKHACPAKHNYPSNVNGNKHTEHTSEKQEEQTNLVYECFDEVRLKHITQRNPTKELKQCLQRGRDELRRSGIVNDKRAQVEHFGELVTHAVFEHTRLT